MGYSHITSSEPSQWFRNIATDKNHGTIASNGRTFIFLDKNSSNVEANNTKLSFKKIVELARNILKQENIDDASKTDILTGLAHITNERLKRLDQKLSQANIVTKFFINLFSNPKKDIQASHDLISQERKNLFEHSEKKLNQLITNLKNNNPLNLKEFNQQLLLCFKTNPQKLSSLLENLFNLIPEKIKEASPELNSIIDALFAASKDNPSDLTTYNVILKNLTDRLMNANLPAEAIRLALKGAENFNSASRLINGIITASSAFQKVAPLDTTFLKNNNLSVQKRKNELDQSYLSFNGKLNHGCRAQIVDNINKLNGIQMPSEAPCKSITVKHSNTGSYHSATNPQEKFVVSSSTIEVHFVGLGKVILGNSKDIYCEFNNLKIELDPGIPPQEAAAKLNFMLQVLGLDPLTFSQRSEDVKRVQLLTLFKAFYPSECHTLEREWNIVNSSPENIEAEICNRVPNMKSIIKEYLPKKMYKTEVYPGQEVWAVRGIADAMRKNKALGLIQGIGSLNALVAMLKGGSLSSQDRFQQGLIITGDSSQDDLRTGGGDSVFTRLITENFVKRNMSATSLNFAGKAMILFGLEIVERAGTYGYPSDQLYS